MPSRVQSTQLRSFYTGIISAPEYFDPMVLFLKFVLTLGFGLVILALL